MQQDREKWVDDVKVVACILVVLGHFFQSMTQSAILPQTMLHKWFNTTIYYFHVPLFFICSGYLYQKKKDSSLWWKRILRKMVFLGVPYVVFSTATWLLKELFSGTVNTQNVGLLHTLLLEPASPYWYLYTLFFMFLLIPRFSDSKIAVLGILIAVILKGIRICNLVDTGIYFVDSVMDNSIWFVLGMLLQSLPELSSRWKKRQFAVGAGSMVAFLTVSLWLCVQNIRGNFISTVMGLWGCGAVLLLMHGWKPGRGLRRVADLVTSYNMPIFLMHTIFAAGLRAILQKLGITVPAIHVICGIAVSFIGPVIAAYVIEKLKLDFVLYPGKYLKREKQKGSEHG